MISRLALRRVLFVSSKHRCAQQQHSVSSTLSRFLRTTAVKAQCEEPMEPSLADAMALHDIELDIDENNFDIDELSVLSADVHHAELDVETESVKTGDDGNFNYDELLLNIAESGDAAFDVDEIRLPTEDAQPDEIVTDKSPMKEENFNYDEMLLNSALDESALDGEGDADVDSFLSGQSDDIRLDILGSALDFVPQHGWTMTSIEKSVEQLGLPDTSTAMFKEGGLDLLLFFIEEANNTLIDYMAKQSKEKQPNTEEARAAFIEDAMKKRLQMIVPYIDTWPQALTLMASPTGAKEILENGANLMDEIFYHAGDLDTDITWYAKRAVLAGISASTELFMLNDKSPDYQDTWLFLHRRLNDARAMGGAKDSLINAAGDTLALVNAGMTTAQNMLGFGDRKR